MLTQERLKKLFHYNPETGLFTRLIVTAKRTKIGDIAGSPHGDGYLRIKIDNKPYYSHRLAWFYMTGKWPKGQIDHINRIRDDNRFANFREVTRSFNLRNTRLYKTNTSGVIGVHLYKPTGKWQARIGVNSKNISLGHFIDKKDAIKARKNAEIKYGFSPTHGAQQ